MESIYTYVGVYNYAVTVQIELLSML